MPEPINPPPNPPPLNEFPGVDTITVNGVVGTVIKCTVCRHTNPTICPMCKPTGTENCFGCIGNGGGIPV